MAESFDTPIGGTTDTPNVHAPGEPAVEGSQRLLTLQRAVRLAIEQFAALLQRRRTSPDAESLPETDRQLSQALESISLRQDSLEELLLSRRSAKVRTIGDGTPVENETELESAWKVGVSDRLTHIEAALQVLLKRLDVVSRPLVEEDDCAETGEFVADNLFASQDRLNVPATTTECPRWLSAILGPQLCDDPQLSDAIAWLEVHVLNGDSIAQYFLGQMLVFRESSPNRKPMVLKDLGEAYYHCFPKGRGRVDLFERAIGEWVERHCIEAGLQNTVEQVNLGDRFDGNRHTALSKGGVEVSEVLGWIVLREGGKVFARAPVRTQ